MRFETIFWLFFIWVVNVFNEKKSENAMNEEIWIIVHHPDEGHVKALKQKKILFRWIAVSVWLMHTPQSK